MSSIEISEIEHLFKSVIDKLKKENVNSIDIYNDFYRFIPADKWDSYEENIILVGSLDDDVESLKKVLNDPDRELTFVDFDRLASVLHAISQLKNPI